MNQNSTCHEVIVITTYDPTEKWVAFVTWPVRQQPQNQLAINQLPQ